MLRVASASNISQTISVVIEVRRTIDSRSFGHVAMILSDRSRPTVTAKTRRERLESALGTISDGR